MRLLNKYTVPAVIIGGGLNALGIVRSLGKVGIPLLVCDTDPASPAMRSRYGKKVLFSQLEDDEFIARLLELAQDFTAPAILFLTEEKSVVTVSEQRQKLTNAYLIRLPQHERLMQLMHKQGFYDLAKDYDAPIPKMVRLKSVEDLPLLQSLQFPCVFKPGKKDYTYGAHFKKAYKVGSPAEVEALYREIAPVLADMVVQEWIEGVDGEIYFCLQYIGANGEIISAFTGRKIRSWPLHVGGTASCIAAWEQERELTETTRQFFHRAGFTGMGSMEYKRDCRDGRFYMIEPTVARTDFQQEVATINGINMPLAAYCHELGLAMPAQPRVPASRIWRDPLSDRWALEESGGIEEQRTQSSPVSDAYWRWTDPRPWIDMMRNRLLLRFGLKK